MSAMSEARRIFDLAAELPAGERGGVLDRECGGDAGLRKEVESLLGAHDRAGAFLLSPEVKPEQLGMAETLAAGTRVDVYTLVHVIGAGGSGTVYLAQQDAPLRRAVALKVINAGMDTPQVLARFDLERQTLALLEHPHIASVFDAGTTRAGRPYFVMEWVDGRPVTEFCRQERFAVDQRLELFLQVCGAIQHAHARGIVHRDLKPWNILVALRDGQPVAKIIDFGIAKSLGPQITDGPALTQQAEFLGTPQYMSPEQADMPAPHVDSRSDIYSLGAILYELITDLPPFAPERVERATFVELNRILHGVTPPAPSARLLAHAEQAGGLSDAERGECRRRAARLREGLDQVVARAMEKLPDHRYQSASALAADISRFLRHEPVAPGKRALRRAADRRGRHYAIIGGVAVAMAVVTGIIVWKTRIAPAPGPDPTLIPGLQGEYFSGTELRNRVLARTDEKIDFSWGAREAPLRGLSAGNFSIRWTGVINVPANGATLGLKVDDRANMWIDGQPVIQLAKPGERFAAQKVPGGPHDIRVEYINALNFGEIHLQWILAGDDPQPQTVPRTAFFHKPP